MAEKELKADSEELKEIREEYTLATNEKQHIREEGDTDMCYITNPWLAKDNKDDYDKRDEAGRATVSADELSQHVNQLINDVRQNKRGAKVAPMGAGADEKTAQLRQELIRQIEYRSNAALDAYPVMFENAVQRSYGYLRVKPDYTDHRSFDQELRILSIPNPNMVTEDPYALSPTGADWKFLYFAESWAKDDLKRRWPKAKKVSFDSDAMKLAPDWIKAGRVLVAERWRVTTKKRKLLLVQMPSAPGQPPAPPVAKFADELDLKTLPKGAIILKDREVDYPQVKQQIVNGVEILEENDFPGTSIPFVACYGKVMYMDIGDGPKKHILSLIRLARDPQMFYNVYRSQQAELAAMIPKTPIGGYKGQFAGVENDWQKAPHEPLAFIEFNFTADNWNANWGPMPPPQRVMYSAADHLQALELCAEGARRAIQAAVGTSPLPTQAQRRNEKSGVALKQIEDTAQKGSFHFIDHFDSSLVRTWEITNELIPFYYDAARDVTVRKGDDQPAQVRINDPSHPESVSATDGQHDLTISVGPRQISEREAASDFADSILNSALLKLMDPAQAKQLAALAIRLKSVGPLGDQMADILSPKEEGKPSPEQLQQMQQQVQELQKQLQQAADEIKTDKAKQQAQIEMQAIKSRADVAIQRMKDATQLAVAKIEASTKGGIVQFEAENEAIALAAEQEHEAAQAEIDRQHEAAMAQMGAHNDAAAADQAHGNAVAQGDAAHQQAMEQAANQAALQPPPAEGT